MKPINLPSAVPIYSASFPYTMRGGGLQAEKNPSIATKSQPFSATQRHFSGNCPNSYLLLPVFSLFLSVLHTNILLILPSLKTNQFPLYALCLCSPLQQNSLKDWSILTAFYFSIVLFYCSLLKPQ